MGPRCAPFSHALITCEHASCAWPARWGGDARPPETALAGHRGSDLGAAAVARSLAAVLGLPLVSGRVSRLLIDLNRSLSHPQVFSPYSRRLTAEARQQLVEGYYRPHRQRVLAALLEAMKASDARPDANHGGDPGGARAHLTHLVHWAVHSFTPRLRGQSRPYEVGLLYDPGRPAERQLMLSLRRALAEGPGGLRVVLNRPYQGKSDGLTRCLRALLGPRYVGIELELNQGWLARGGAWRHVVHAVAQLGTDSKSFDRYGVRVRKLS